MVDVISLPQVITADNGTLKFNQMLLGFFRTCLKLCLHLLPTRKCIAQESSSLLARNGEFNTITVIMANKIKFEGNTLSLDRQFNRN